MFSLMRYGYRHMFPYVQIKLCVLGLEGSGKSLFVNALKHHYHVGGIAASEVRPTKGQDFFRFDTDAGHFSCTDVAGSRRQRRFWHHYFDDADVVCVVIDASNSAMTAKNCELVDILLVDPRLASCHFVLLVNRAGDDDGSGVADETAEVYRRYVKHCPPGVSGRVATFQINCLSDDPAQHTGVTKFADWLHALAKNRAAWEPRMRLKRELAERAHIARAAGVVDTNESDAEDFDRFGANDEAV